MKPVKVHARCDLKKPQGYIKRNWPKASIKLKEKAEAKAAEKLAAQEAREARLAEKIAKKIEARTATLERSPKADLLDLSTEEQGFFKLGDKVIETFFPR